MLAVILDNKLLRFAAAVRAAGVWLGLDANVTQIPLVEERVRALAAYRADRAQRAAALTSGDPWDAYVALCAGGMRDVTATIGEAKALAAAPTEDRRAVAVRYAAATGLASGQELVAAAVDDQDIRVAALASGLLNHEALRRPGTFDALARLANRLPVADREAPAVGVEQRPVTISRTATAGRLVQALGDRPVGDLLPWLPVMDANGRARVARLLAGTAQPAPQDPVFSGIAVMRLARPARDSRTGLSAEFRPVVIGLLTDRSSYVRRHRDSKRSRGRPPRPRPRHPPSRRCLPARQATCAVAPSPCSPRCPRSTPRRPPPASPRARTSASATREPNWCGCSAPFRQTRGGPLRHAPARQARAVTSRSTCARRTWWGAPRRPARDRAEEGRAPDRSTVGAAAAGDRRARRQAPRRPGDPRQLARASGRCSSATSGTSRCPSDAGCAAAWPGTPTTRAVQAEWSSARSSAPGGQSVRTRCAARTTAATRSARTRSRPPFPPAVAQGSREAPSLPRSSAWPAARTPLPDRLVAGPAAPVHRQTAGRAQSSRRRPACHVLACGRACERSRH